MVLSESLPQCPTDKTDNTTNETTDESHNTKHADPGSQPECSLSSNSGKSANDNKKKRNGIDYGVRKEVNRQLAYYIDNERRQLGFSAKHVKAVCKTENAKQSALTAIPEPAVSRAEKKRLLEFANRNLEQVDIDEIWKFHQYQLHSKLPKAPRNGFVPNYSRHTGNILQTI